jgi:predicted nucleic-acid-binding Zn-ribbon protein
MEPTLANGKCPKCGATEIYYTDSPSDSIIPQEPLRLMGSRPRVVVMVCGQCGWVELNISAKELGRVKKHWERLPTE